MLNTIRQVQVPHNAVEKDILNYKPYDINYDMFEHVIVPLLYPDTATDYFNIDNEDIIALRKGVTEASFLTLLQQNDPSIHNNSLSPTATTIPSSPRSPDHPPNRVSVTPDSSSSFSSSPSRALHQISGSKSLTYGEIRPVSIEQHILPALQLQDNDVVYDLGCGTGKISLQIALWCITHNLSNIQSKGIELAKVRIQAGEKAVDIMRTVGSSSSAAASLKRNEILTPLAIEDQLRKYYQLLQQQTNSLFTSASSSSVSSSIPSSPSSPRRRSRQQLYSSCYNRNGMPTLISSSSLLDNKFIHTSTNDLPIIARSMAATIARAGSLCALYQGDILTDDYSDATVIFINNTVFDQTLMIPLVAKLATLPKLRKLVVLRKLCGRHTQCEKFHRPCSVFFDPPVEGICNPTWCDNTTIFTYTRKPFGSTDDINNITESSSSIITSSSSPNRTKKSTIPGSTNESPVKRLKNQHTTNNSVTINYDSKDQLWRHSPIDSNLYTETNNQSSLITSSSTTNSPYEPPPLPARKYRSMQNTTTTSDTMDDTVSSRTATKALAQAIEANRNSSSNTMMMTMVTDSTTHTTSSMDTTLSFLETPAKSIDTRAIRRGVSTLTSPGLSSVSSSDNSPIVSKPTKNTSPSSSVVRTIGQKFNDQMVLETKMGTNKGGNSNNNSNASTRNNEGRKGNSNTSGSTRILKHPDPLIMLRD